MAMVKPLTRYELLARLEDLFDEAEIYCNRGFAAPDETIVGPLCWSRLLNDDEIWAVKKALKSAYYYLFFDAPLENHL